jgi:type III pantothenate kinase
MILCDIGNSRMHFFDDGTIKHLSYEEGIAIYGKMQVFYICVSDRAQTMIIRSALSWVDLSKHRVLETAYRGLGIDREAACLGISDGIVIDAGSAITVDVMEKGVHRGGWIWPGIRAMLEAYKNVSPKLSFELDTHVALDRLPMETKDAISFGILASIKELIGRFSIGKDVVVTGGDAEIVAALLPGARVDETLVFKGMKQMLKDVEC